MQELKRKHKSEKPDACWVWKEESGRACTLGTADSSGERDGPKDGGLPSPAQRPQWRHAQNRASGRSSTGHSHTLIEQQLSCLGFQGKAFLLLSFRQRP